jgi:uncharacterized protein
VLRGEHVMARLQRGRLVPHSLSATDGRARGAAEALIATVDAYVGRPRAELEAALAAHEEEIGGSLDPRRGFRIVRALSKLLDERISWTAPSEADPYTVRTRVFELAAELPEPPATSGGLISSPTHADVLLRVAREMSLDDPLSVMYADRQGAQVVAGFDEPTPEELLLRYNVAQIQGVLYAARELVVDLDPGADARLVFHYVKFMGLVYRVEPRGDGHRILLDGPLSLFGGTRKYGLRLAKFLPGLLLTSPWRLSANVEWRGRDAVLELDSSSPGLATHYAGPRELQERDEDARAAFTRAWQRARDTGGWELRDGPGILPVPSRGSALVPDFTFVNGATGQLAHLEILGFWSERYLVDRVALVREAANRGDRVLLAASDKMTTDPQALEEAASGKVIPFKGRLDVKAVVAALDAPSTSRGSVDHGWSAGTSG